MVIVFSNDRARRHLLEEGRVYTYRAKKRKKVGFDWLTDKRGGSMLRRVHISEEREIRLPEMVDALSPYSPLSGFSTTATWIEAIQERCKGKIPRVGYLYRVVLPRENDEEV